MRTTRSQFVYGLATLLLICFIAQPAAAQRAGQGSGQARNRSAESVGLVAAQGQLGYPADLEPERNPKRVMRGMPQSWMERLRGMSPEEQERFLENNERFKNLPPERQEQIRKRLQHWNSLSSEQQRAVRERERVWHQLSPEQRRHVREDLLPRWKQLSPDRRHLLLEKLGALRDLNVAERNAKLSDEDFLDGLNAEERAILRELSGLRVHTPDSP